MFPDPARAANASALIGMDGTLNLAPMNLSATNQYLDISAIKGNMFVSELEGTDPLAFPSLRRMRFSWSACWLLRAALSASGWPRKRFRERQTCGYNSSRPQLPQDHNAA